MNPKPELRWIIRAVFTPRQLGPLSEVSDGGLLAAMVVPCCQFTACEIQPETRQAASFERTCDPTCDASNMSGLRRDFLPCPPRAADAFSTHAAILAEARSSTVLRWPTR